jgi:predicted AlkP superfamily pyrophosphatase or phosphodiesterase
VRHRTCWLLLLLAGSGASAAQPIRHVVLVTVDGLRPDAIAAAPAPHLAAAMRAGAHTLAARTVDPPETLPAHVSIATGLPPARHGVSTNKELGRPIEAQGIFSQVHAGGGRTALYHGKAKLMDLARPDVLDRRRGPGRGEADWRSGASQTLVRQFAQDFAADGFAFAWVHLREPDLAGHKAGWMSADYLAAVREADAAFGALVRALAESGRSAQTALLVTSDHGGDRQEHWGRNEADFPVPWACVVPGVRGGTPLPADTTVLDTAATALALLQLPPLPQSPAQPVKACLPTSR